MGQFDCSNAKGVKSVLPYAQADGFQAYTPDSFQHLFDYCDNHTDPSTHAPVFDVCTYDAQSGEFLCKSQQCTLISTKSGVTCKTVKEYNVKQADSMNYIAFSETDNTAEMDLCNVTLEDAQLDH